MTHARQALPFAVLSLAVAGMGVYVAQADDAPGAAVVGALLMVAGLVLGLKRARGRLPRRVAFVTLALGVGVAAGAAYLTHSVVVRAPLFANVAAIPSTETAEPTPQYAAAVQRGRSLARAAVLEQNLPGLSVAVGTNGTIVWAEGFGWRDIDTRAPVTPDTRFTIGTAAATIANGIEPLGLTCGTSRAA